MNDTLDGLLERIKDRGLEHLRQDIAKASGRAKVDLLLLALLCCCQNRLLVPPWVGDSFRHAFSQWLGLHVDSLDEAFGLPFPRKRPARRETARRRNTLTREFLSELLLLNDIGGWVDFRALSSALVAPTDVLKDLMEKLLALKKFSAAIREKPSGGSVEVESLVSGLAHLAKPTSSAQRLTAGERWASRVGQAKLRTVLQALQGKVADVQKRSETRKRQIVYWEDLAKTLGSYHHELQSFFTKEQLADWFPHIVLRERGR